MDTNPTSQTQVQHNVEMQNVYVEHKNVKVQVPLFANTSRVSFTHEMRSEFYTGHERHTLQSRNLQRVRELQESNDSLQRQVVRNKSDLTNSKDPLTLVADTEQCCVMIARNTGEILHIYAMNDGRLKRIAELEAQNLDLQQDMSDSQGKFITAQDMSKRTQYASTFFLKKATYEKNLAEIRELSQE